MYESTLPLTPTPNSNHKSNSNSGRRSARHASHVTRGVPFNLRELLQLQHQPHPPPTNLPTKKQQVSPPFSISRSIVPLPIHTHMPCSWILAIPRGKWNHTPSSERRGVEIRARAALCDQVQPRGRHSMAELTEMPEGIPNTPSSNSSIWIWHGLLSNPLSACFSFLLTHHFTSHLPSSGVPSTNHSRRRMDGDGMTASRIAH